MLKFIYSEKAAKFCEIFTLLLTTVHTVKSKVKISQNFGAFSEYMNFKPFIFRPILPIFSVLFSALVLMPSGQPKRNKQKKPRKRKLRKKIRVKVISLVSYSRIKRQDCPMSAITQVVPRAQYKH